MARLIALKPRVRKRGNPNWGKSSPPAPNLLTRFEKEVQRLGLIPETYAMSAELRVWCERNKNQFYIPEWLLDTWGLTLETIIDKTIQRLIRAA